MDQSVEVSNQASHSLQVGRVVFLHLCIEHGSEEFQFEQDLGEIVHESALRDWACHVLDYRWLVLRVCTLGLLGAAHCLGHEGQESEVGRLGQKHAEV